MAKVVPLHAIPVVDPGLALFWKHYVQILDEQLLALHLPRTLVRTFEPTPDELRGLSDVFLHGGDVAWLHALRRLLETKWEHNPHVYWWPWSEQWT